MNNVAKIGVYATLCVAIGIASGLGWSQAQTAMDNQLHRASGPGGDYLQFIDFTKNRKHPLADRYPELYGDDAKPTIVVFKAPWCSACYVHASTVTALKARGYRVKTYNIDDHAELFGEINRNTRLRHIPYTALLKNGEVEHDWVGIRNWTVIARDADGSYKRE